MFSTTLKQHQDEYQALGLTILSDIIPDNSLSRAFHRIMPRDPSSFVDVNLEPDEESLTYGGLTKYKCFDYPTTLEIVPQVQGWYEALRPLIGLVANQDVILSPYPGSEVITLLYEGDGGQQEYHLDTQPITVLLYLNDNATSGATRAFALGGEGESTGMMDIFPKRGNILVMQGRRVKHCGLPVLSGTKMVMPMNYYVRGDTWRPENLQDPNYWENRKAVEA